MNTQNTDTNIILVPEILESNGLSVRENNMDKNHSIPLFTLVELVCDDHENGLRFFVQNHSRDCDGTPLYDLTTDTKLVGIDLSLSDALNGCKKDLLSGIFVAVDFGKIRLHYHESALKIVREASVVIDSLKAEGIIDEDCKVIN